MGGRYRFNLSLDQERELMADFFARVSRGQVLIVAEIQAAVSKLVGKPVHSSGIHKLLARHGWRKIVPRPQHPRGDPVAREEFKKLPDHVYAQAERADLSGRMLRVFFQDEARFGHISDPRRCWSPKDVRPTVESQHIREYLYAFAAVCPQDGQLTSLITDHVDAETMSLFLAQVAAEYPNDDIFMILGGAGWHRAGALRVLNSLHRHFLPPYSPQLNPAENLWDDLREKHFFNRCVASLTAVKDTLCIALRELHHDHNRTQSIIGFAWITAL